MKEVLQLRELYFDRSRYQMRQVMAQHSVKLMATQNNITAITTRKLTLQRDGSDLNYRSTLDALQ